MSIGLYKYIRNNAFFFVGLIIALFLGVLYAERFVNPNLKCIVSKIDGNAYCVRERKRMKSAANLLARATLNCKILIKYLKNKYKNDYKVTRLVENFNPNTICEIQPTSDDVAYNENKGDVMAFCLNEKKNGTELIDLHTLTFVVLHELAHTMTISNGHEPEFWDNFKFLLKNAKDIGIHEPVNYSENPTMYCGMKLGDNPYYNS